MAQESNQIARDPVADAPTSSDATTPPSATPTEIRAQIEHTRAEMSQTIDAIQARLSPSRVVAEAKETVKDATVGRVKRLARGTRGAFRPGVVERYGSGQIIQGLKANPMPLALIGGVAAAALVVRTLARSRNRTAVRPYGDTEGHHRSRINCTHASVRGRRFLVGACAGLACWSAWRVQQPSARAPG
jgi:hypothetical protein